MYKTIEAPSVGNFKSLSPIRSQSSKMQNNWISAWKRPGCNFKEVPHPQQQYYFLCAKMPAVMHIKLEYE